MSSAIASFIQCFKVILSGFATVIEGTKVIVSQIGPAFASVKAVLSIALTKLFAVCLSLMYAINGYVAPPTDDVIKSVDYIVDLGPEGGDRGGNIVVSGTPEEVAKCEKSYTGQFLKKLL